MLVLVALDPEIVHKEIAVRLGCTRRAVINFLRTLTDLGLVEVTRVGRCNRYAVALDAPVPKAPGVTIGQLIALFSEGLARVE